MKKRNLTGIVVLLVMCCSFFTGCDNGNSTSKKDVTSFNYTNVNWDEDLSWFVGKWESIKIISDGIDVTDCDYQELEYSSDGKIVKWTSTLTNSAIVPAGTKFQDLKSIFQTSYNFQLNDDMTVLKQTVSKGSLSTIYYFMKK